MYNPRLNANEEYELYKRHLADTEPVRARSFEHFLSAAVKCYPGCIGWVKQDGVTWLLGVSESEVLRHINRSEKSNV